MGIIRASLSAPDTAEPHGKKTQSLANEVKGVSYHPLHTGLIDDDAPRCFPSLANLLAAFSPGPTPSWPPAIPCSNSARALPTPFGSPPIQARDFLRGETSISFRKERNIYIGVRRGIVRTSGDPRSKNKYLVRGTYYYGGA